MTVRHVFVYGTLRQGQSNDINRLHPRPVFVGMGQVMGVLHNLGAYPGLLLGQGGWVSGEVYAMDPALEAVLDGIEDIRPGSESEYFKRQVMIEVNAGALSCLVYEINPRYGQQHPLIPSGDWVKAQRGPSGAHDESSDISAKCGPSSCDGGPDRTGPGKQRR